MNQSNNLPLLLKRKHLLREFGLSDSLYYALLQSGELPTITLNGRKYIHRDKFLELINNISYSADRERDYEEDKISPV